MFSRDSRLLTRLFRLNDILLTVVSFFIAYLLRDQALPAISGPMGRFHRIYPLNHYASLVLGIAVVWFLVGSALHLYRNVDKKTSIQIAGDVFSLVVVGLLVVYASLYLVKGESISRSLLFLFAVTDAALVFLGRIVLLNHGHHHQGSGEKKRYVLIVGTGPEALRMWQRIESHGKSRTTLVGFLELSPAVNRTSKSTYPHYPATELSSLLKGCVIDDVLFAVEGEELQQIQPLLEICEQEGVTARVTWQLPYRGNAKVYLDSFEEVPLLTFSNAPDPQVQLVLKRLFDICVVTIACLVFWPLIVVVALLVKLTSPGPVLYKQVRCGLGGRKFTLFKFRSMYVGAEDMRPNLESLNELDGPVFKIKDDPRCTPIGSWLRRHSLDEIPQLWNVLRGDMSLVGPRPPLPEEVTKYEPHQRRRLRVRPGLTCLWVLEGRNNLNFERWIQLDLSYIDRWSFWLDLKILLLSIPYVVIGHGAH